VNAYIFTFLVVGACFGLATFSHRHLFSEGPHRAEDDLQTSSLASRTFWTMVCTFLWPVMIITGVNTAWILAKRKKIRRMST
jgi:hypothetical protein